jgi:Protein of unknown function (DUF1579)
MKARVGIVAVLTALLLASLAAPARAQEKRGEPWKPGPEHQKLAALAGDYTTVSTFRMRPDDTGKGTNGTATLTSVLGGRFLREQNGGEFMGQPTAGLRLYGYNDQSKQYEATWVYTGSTAMMPLRGLGKDDGKTIEWTGSFDEAGGQKMTLYVVMHLVDADHFTVELYAKNPDGSKGPTLETAYTRRK